MSEIIFKRETAPARCEICHQSDLFDAEQNHCERCDNLPVKQMAETADAAVSVTLPPLTPPGLWRFHGAISLIPTYFLLGGCLFALTSGPFKIPKSICVLLVIGGYLGGVGLEALIRYVIREKNGSLPLNINNLIDEGFLLSLGLLGPVGLFYYLLVVVTGLVFKVVPDLLYLKVVTWLAISIPLLSIFISYRVMLKRFRRLSIRAVHIDRKTL